MITIIHRGLLANISHIITFFNTPLFNCFENIHWIPLTMSSATTSSFLYVKIIDANVKKFAYDQQSLLAKFYIFLPPANEVWGKVMFKHLSVMLFTGRGCIPACNGLRVYTSLGRHLPGQTPPPPRQTHTHTPSADTPRQTLSHPNKTATEAGGTHPTGMHSFYWL